jgi:hypothetical protein
MRCPYCQAINQDRAVYCARCGRDMRQARPPQPNPQYQPPPHQQPPYRQPGQAPPTMARPASTMPPAQQAVRPRQTEFPVTPPAPPPPEPPAPFPPRTIEQLQALEQGALNYTVVSDTASDGRKKIVRVTYARCAPWQQVATLLQACKEHQEERFDTIIVQGVLPQDSSSYSFTNGQLVFDRNVRLGSLTTKRYQIETGNGYESDSVRIVLTEQ